MPEFDNDREKECGKGSPFLSPEVIPLSGRGNVPVIAPEVDAYPEGVAAQQFSSTPAE